MSDMEQAMKKANKKMMMKKAKQQNKLKEMEDEFMKSKTLGIYNYMTDIDSQSLLKYVIILIVIIYLTSFLEIKFNFIFALISGILIIYFLNEKRRATESGEMG